MASLTVDKIQWYCELLGVRLSVQGDRLRVEMPNRLSDAVQAKLKAMLIANEQRLIASLRATPCPCPVAKLRKRSKWLFQCSFCGQVWVMGLTNQVSQ